MTDKSFYKSLATESPEINEELTRIQEGLEEAARHFPTQVDHTLPEKNQNLDVRFFENVEGMTGLYIYWGGAWRQIQVSGL
jgi:hypothetical protein